MTNRHQIRYRGSRPGLAPSTVSVDPGPSWMTDPDRGCAPAKGRTELFYSDFSADIRRAKAICGLCPFRVECLAYAEEKGESFGVWGGVDRKKRKRMTESRKAKAAAAVTSQAQEQRSTRAQQRRELEQQVAQLWQRGLSDSIIAVNLSRNIGTISKIRGRLHLAAHYGPGGRPRRVAVSACCAPTSGPAS